MVCYVILCYVMLCYIIYYITLWYVMLYYCVILCYIYIYIYIYGAAAKVLGFDRLWKKARPGTFGTIKVGQREFTKLYRRAAAAARGGLGPRRAARPAAPGRPELSCFVVLYTSNK